jgi:hypothetical protein
MATPAGPLDGDALLATVSDAMSELYARYYQRPPTTSKARMMGADLLACVLGGVYTDVEKTLIELERGSVVRENRNMSQDAMHQRFIDTVQRLLAGAWNSSSPATTSAPTSRSSSSSSPRRNRHGRRPAEAGLLSRVELAATP